MAFLKLPRAGTSPLPPFKGGNFISFQCSALERILPRLCLGFVQIVLRPDHTREIFFAIRRTITPEHHNTFAPYFY